MSSFDEPPPPPPGDPPAGAAPAWMPMLQGIFKSCNISADGRIDKRELVSTLREQAALGIDLSGVDNMLEADMSEEGQTWSNAYGKRSLGRVSRNTICV